MTENDLPDADDPIDEVIVEAPIAKFRCRGCDYRAATHWTRECPRCFRYYDCIAIRNASPDDDARNSLGAQVKRPRQRISSGFPEFDKILGGGDVRMYDNEGNVTEIVDTGWGFKPGFVYLISGRKGLGKTTLAIEAANNVARGGRTALIASGEMNREAVIEMAGRVGAINPAVKIIGTDSADDDGDCGGGDLYHVVEVAQAMKPKPSLIVVDSAQKMFLRDVEADLNSDHQAKAAGNYLTSFAQQVHCAVFLIGQMNKAGEAAGPESLMHAVDAIMLFDEGAVPGMRIVSCPEKNRGGRTGDDVEAFLEMSPEDGKIVSPSPKMLRKIARLASTLEVPDEDEDETVDERPRGKAEPREKKRHIQLVTDEAED